MTKNKELLQIRIYKDKGMMITDWIIFLFCMLLVVTFLSSFMGVIASFEKSNEKLLAVVVFTFISFKLVDWVRMPTRYSVDLAVEDLKEELKQ